jgi:hypothetical protein
LTVVSVSLVLRKRHRLWGRAVQRLVLRCHERVCLWHILRIEHSNVIQENLLRRTYHVGQFDGGRIVITVRGFRSAGVLELLSQISLDKAIPASDGS